MQPTDHIIVNHERLVLTRRPFRAGDRLDLDEVGAGEQCEGCGEDAAETLHFVAIKNAFRCGKCDHLYPVQPGGYED